MHSAVRTVVKRTVATVRDDLRSDPVLRYILLLSLILSGFWFWWRIPNFATADEYGRLLRPMKAAGEFFADPGFESFKRGATDGLAQGATFYLYGLVLIPIFLFVVGSGQLGNFASFASIESRWTLWHAVPAWFWASSLLLARFLNVLIAVSAVYVVYRIGTEMADRQAGRIAATVVALSLGFIASAHEANEDTAMVLLLLVVLYLSLRYRRTGDETHFLVGCAIGGLTIAFKLTGGVVVFFLGTAFFLRVTETDGSLRALIRPRLLLTGLLLGVVTIYIGVPTILLSGPDAFTDYAILQLTIQSTGKAAATAPFGYGFVRAYLNALGLPLAIGSVAGVGIGIRQIVSDPYDGRTVILSGVAIYFIVFVTWKNIRTHHILPMSPLIALLIAAPFARWLLANRSYVKRGIVAGLLITTGIYVGAGVIQYATDPRDEATEWIRSEVATNATIVVYEDSVADVGIVHGQPVEQYDFVEKVGVSNQVANESAYTEWMVSTPERHPEYIQVTASALRYVDEPRSDSARYPRRSAYVRRLVDGDHFGYVIAAKFGDRPRRTSRLQQLLSAGIVPEIEKREPYVLIFASDELDTEDRKITIDRAG